MDASGRGDNRRQEGLAQAGSHVTLPIFVDLLLRPLRQREVKVLMAQGAIHRRGYQRCNGSREPWKCPWRPHEANPRPMGGPASPPQSTDPEREEFEDAEGQAW